MHGHILLFSLFCSLASVHTYSPPCQSDICSDCPIVNIPARSYHYFHLDTPCTPPLTIPGLYNLFLSSLNGTEFMVYTVNSNEIDNFNNGLRFYYYQYFSNTSTSCIQSSQNLTVTGANNLYVIVRCNTSCSVKYWVNLQCVVDPCAWRTCRECTLAFFCMWCVNDDGVDGSCVSIDRATYCVKYDYFCPTTPTDTSSSYWGFMALIVIPIGTLGSYVALVVYLRCRPILPNVPNKFHQLPDELNRFNGEESLQQLDPSDEEYQKIQEIFQKKLGGEHIKIKKLYVIIQPNLYQQFKCRYELVVANGIREVEKPPDFLKLNTYNHFLQLLLKFDWNSPYPNRVPMVLMIYGTDFKTAKKIFRTGFASYSKLDAGWYGNGIYFTSSALYALPYWVDKNKPAIIVTFVIAGKPLFVVDKMYSGKPLNLANQCHYVLVSSNGNPVTIDDDEHVYDEMVIGQEAQMLPAYIIVPRKDNLEELTEMMKPREIPKRTYLTTTTDYHYQRVD